MYKTSLDRAMEIAIDNNLSDSDSLTKFYKDLHSCGINLAIWMFWHEAACPTGMGSNISKEFGISCNKHEQAPALAPGLCFSCFRELIKEMESFVREPHRLTEEKDNELMQRMNFFGMKKFN